VIQPATRGELLGYPAAHVRFSVPTACPKGRVALLWSMFPASTVGLPGIGLALRDGQKFDLWVLDVEGSMVVVAAAHSPELPKSLVAEANAVVDSLRIDVLRQ